MTSSHPLPTTCQWFTRIASALDRRSAAPRPALLFLGAVLARGRRTVTSWIRAAGLSGQYQSCYLAVAAGRKAETIAASLADKRRAWRGELLGEENLAVLRPGATEEEIQATAERLLSLAA